MYFRHHTTWFPSSFTSCAICLYRFRATIHLREWLNLALAYCQTLKRQNNISEATNMLRTHPTSDEQHTGRRSVRRTRPPLHCFPVCIWSPSPCCKTCYYQGYNDHLNTCNTSYYTGTSSGDWYLYNLSKLSLFKSYQWFPHSIIVPGWNTCKVVKY